MRKTWMIGMVGIMLWGITCLPGSVDAETGYAALMSTWEESPTPIGEMRFEDRPEGLAIDATFFLVPPGVHGFHIHEFGSCDDRGKAAGGHYNPTTAAHGDVIAQGALGAHAGDLGNATIRASGTGELHLVVPDLSLSESRYTVAGRAVILHERPDDFSQPTGNAGLRIGCGVILITGS